MSAKDNGGGDQRAGRHTKSYASGSGDSIRFDGCGLCGGPRRDLDRDRDRDLRHHAIDRATTNSANSEPLHHFR
jgi:hypothetical protein